MLETLKFTEQDFAGNDVSALPDDPSGAGYTAEQLKARFDHVARDMVALDKYNGLIDALLSKETDSGANNIGLAPIEGLDAENVQQAAKALMTYADTAAVAAENRVAAYSDTAAAAAVSAANAYADEACEAAVGEANTYADASADAAKQAANKYTDSAAQAAAAQTRIYADQKDEEAVAEAKTYADGNFLKTTGGEISGSLHMTAYSPLFRVGANNDRDTNYFMDVGPNAINTRMHNSDGYAGSQLTLNSSGGKVKVSYGGLEVAGDANFQAKSNFAGDITAERNVSVGRKLTVAADPEEDLEVATKHYVDVNSSVAKGFELIESITVGDSVTQIERTSEPDGTAYNFKRYFITMKAPLSSGTGSNILMTVYKDTTYLAQREGGYKVSNKQTFTMWVGGIKDDIWYAGSTEPTYKKGTYILAANPIAYTIYDTPKTASNAKVSNRILFQSAEAIASGTVIRIYAQRA